LASAETEADDDQSDILPAVLAEPRSVVVKAPEISPPPTAVLPPEVPRTCLSVDSPDKARFALELTEYYGVDDVDAFTPRLVEEPTWKLLLVPMELLN
jgi:hypothetical protein